MSLSGLNSIILGAGPGMGRSIALALAKEGSRIALAARTYEKIKFICDEISELKVKCLPIVGDVSSYNSLSNIKSKVLEYFDRIDVIVYNAGGYFSFEGVENISEEYLLGALRNNIVGLYNTVRVFLKELEKSKGALLVTVASPYVILQGNIAYAAAKGGLIWMVKRLAKELANRDIRVVCIAPGFTYREPIEAGGSKLRSLEPQSPDYIGWVVAFLASRRAERITGECIVVDGGLSIL
ncbi:MAG: SDR family oxidoreductase [Acidilobaceae archaeon]